MNSEYYYYKHCENLVNTSCCIDILENELALALSIFILQYLCLMWALPHLKAGVF